MKTRALRRSRQRGAVAIITALSLAVLIGFVGLVLDGGHLFVTRTELQNAADAAALAASRELTCDATQGNCPATYLEAAESTAIAVASRNRMAFQSSNVEIDPDDVRFSTTFAPNGNYLSRNDGADPASRYVMVVARRNGIAPWFMQVLGVEESNVTGYAVATLGRALTNCGIPLGMCTQGPAHGEPPYGLVKGQWYDGRFDAGGGSTGSFNWIDFTPPGGGQSELAELLEGAGQCNLNVSHNVGQSGIMGNAAARAWNSRFGLYQGGGGNPNADTAPPDWSGHAYNPESWPAQRDALEDFLDRRADYDPYTGQNMPGYTVSSRQDHETKGADRRVAVVPLINCGDWESAQTVPIQSWGCVMMLHPIASPQDVVYMEYLGLASDPNSPCATSGSVGGPDSHGAPVPMLVQ